MPSRRTLLAAMSAGFAGCAGAPALSVPNVDAQPCPPVDLPADRAVCSHTDGDGDVSLSVSAAEFSTAPESLEALSLRIDTSATLRYREDGWRLFRNAGWGWTERDVSGGLSGSESIPAGKSAGWHGIDALFHLGAAGPTPAGLYAAVLPVWVNAADTRVACVFLFRVTR